MKTPSIYSQWIDHTLLRPTASEIEIRTLCQEAMDHVFFAVCINPCWLEVCQNLLKESPVKLCTVIGFPLGASSHLVKIFETEHALRSGAQEIDCVLNLGFLKSQKYASVLSELKMIVDLCSKESALVKVIVESGVLTSDELHAAIDLVNQSGASYIKTSTGFAAVGATVDAVKTMRERGRNDLKIKASGGVKTAADFKKYLELGVSRVGCSQSVALLKELESL